MDVAQITNQTATSSGTQVQGSGGHHRHHKSISDQVTAMGTAIDDAVKAGKLTDDQATTMKKELDDVTQALAKNQAATTGQTGATTSASTLSADDRKKLFGELQDVRKQLHAATAPQGTAPGASSDQANQLFASMDADGNGSISKDEFASFMTSLAQKGGYNAQGQSATAAAQSGLSVEA